MECLFPIAVIAIIIRVLIYIFDVQSKFASNVPPVRPKISSAVPDWECSTCGHLNDCEDLYCVVCMEDKLTWKIE
jgi:Na+-translocating ferredoxin:NAD+ oxidoreductase RNF subunit RnfB